MTRLRSSYMPIHQCRLGVSVVLVAIGAVLGCTDPTRPESSFKRHPLRSALQAPGVETIDDQFARIDSLSPGFGGVYLDSTGRTVIALVNIADSTRARFAIASVDPSLLQAGEREGTTAAPRVVGVAQSFGALRSLKSRVLQLSTDIRKSFVDIDEVQNQVTVAVPSDDARSALVARLEGAGLRGARVVVVVAPPGIPEQSVTSRFRPFPSGVKIALANGTSFCTVGVNVVTGSGARGFFTSSHCTGYFGVVNGDFFYQADTGIANLVGYEIADLAPWDCSNLGWSDPCRYSDAALISVDSANLEQGAMIRTIEVDGIFRTIESSSTPRFTHLTPPSGALVANTTIYKMGAYSGWTSGTVQSTCVDVDLWPGDIHGNYFTLLCQYLGNYTSGGGDSGAPVFTRSGTGDVYLRGLHIGLVGTYRAFSRWQYLTMEYNTDLGSLTVTP